MRKITLFIFMLFTIIGGAKAETVASTTEIDATSSKQETSIDAIHFNNLTTGDYFIITIEEAVAGAKLSLKDKEKWDSFVYEAAVTNGEYVSVSITAEQAANIRAKGLYIVLENAKITQVKFAHVNTASGLSIWSGTKEFGEWGELGNTDNNLFASATTDDVIRFSYEVPEGKSQYQILFYHVTGDSWETETLISEINLTADDEGVHLLEISSEMQDVFVNYESNGIKCFRIKGKGVTMKSVELCSPLAITDGANPRCEAGNYARVNLTRNLAVGYNTLCLPFAATKAELGLEGSDVIYEMAEGSTSSNIKFSSVDAIVANKPYLVYCAAARTLTTAFTGLEVSVSDASSTSIGDWTMYGNYEPGAHMDGKYIIYNGEVRKCGSGPTLNGLRAYFTYSGGSLVKNATISFDETGITNVGNEDYSQTDFYNLAGQSTKKPKHGIYVVKGKKVLFK